MKMWRDPKDAARAQRGCETHAVRLRVERDGRESGLAINFLVNGCKNELMAPEAIWGVIEKVTRGLEEVQRWDSYLVMGKSRALTFAAGVLVLKDIERVAPVWQELMMFGTKPRKVAPAAEPTEPAGCASQGSSVHSMASTSVSGI